MLKNLLDVVRAGATGGPRSLPAPIAAQTASAPADVRDLVDVIGTRDVRVSLGWRSIETRYLGSLADTWQQVADDTGESDPRQGDLASGVQIGASAGGEVYFGLCWGSGSVEVAEIDTEDGLIKWFATVDAFLQYMRDAETKRGQAAPEALAAMFPAASAAAAPPAPPAGVEVYAGIPPGHPFAQAHAHFKQEKNVIEVGPTPSGRTVLVRRFAAGNPFTPAALVVREADGTIRALPWTDTNDIYGLCLVPGQERVLVCSGAPGPLLDVDLDTGAQTTRLPNVRWSCGFVDDDHFVVHEDSEARAYAYAGGASPVASAAVEGMNLFVGHGRVFTLPPGPTGLLQIHRFDGGALMDELRSPMEPRVFFLSATAVHDGRRLLCSVDWQGKATWFDVGAA